MMTTIRFTIQVLVLVPILISWSSSSFAQDHPDFTGTWTVEHVDTTEARNPAGREPDGFRGGGGGGGGFGRRGGRGGGGRGNGGGRGADAGDQGRGGQERRGPAILRQGDTMRIGQTADRLIITSERTDPPVMTSYSLDGKETKNHPSDDVEIKSKTTWEGVALVTNSTQSMSTGRGAITIKTREIRTLSDDGQTMTVQSTIDTPGGKRTVMATLTKGS
jgi:hypothetical protein